MNMQILKGIQASLAGLKYDQAASQLNPVTETIGKIVSVTIINSVVSAIIRRTSNDPYNFSFDAKENTPLYNNHLNIDEKKLSAFEVLLPIINIDAEHSIINPATLIGRNVIVTEVGNKAMYATYLGALYTPDDSLTMIPAEHIAAVRNKLNELGRDVEDITEVKSMLVSEYNYPEQFTNDLFKSAFDDWTGKVVIWNGEGVMHKSIDDDKDYELRLDAVNSLKYLNKTPMKTKNCQMFNKIFSGR